MDAESRQRFISFFRQTAPYLHTHRDRTVVVHVGGEILESEGLDDFITDLAILRSVGMKLVVVVGARPQIEARLNQRGVESRYSCGLRVTDAAALACVKEAAGTIRVDMEARLSLGLPNSPMAGAQIRVVTGNFVSARPVGVLDGIDLQMTGRVRRVDAKALRAQLETGSIVLMTPIGYAPTGEVFNLRSLDVATETAVALGADKLVVLHEGEAGRAGAITLDDARALWEDGAEEGEVHRALGASISACERGVDRVHLVQRRREGGLLLELYTKEGVGILVTESQFEDLRPARARDLPGIQELLKPLERERVLVERTQEELLRDVERFTVVEREGQVLACAALYVYAAESMGELACVAVHPDHREKGYGERLLRFIERQASAEGVRSLFVLTTQTTHWFIERGFEPGKPGDLPSERAGAYDEGRSSKILLKGIERPDEV